MSEDDWFNEVEGRLSEQGMSIDMNDDGWYFMYENGWTPSQAISEMYSF